MADSPTFTLNNLGSSDSITFDVHRNVANANVSFSVPAGMTPKELRATLELPVELRFGTLTVKQGDQTISQIDLPPRRPIRSGPADALPPGEAPAPSPKPTPTPAPKPGEGPAPEVTNQQLVIPLEGTPVYGSWVNLSLTITALPLDNYCWDPLTPIRLFDASMTLQGRETPPTNVAKFLPGVLRAVTIAIPGKPSRAESDAAVQLAAEMSSRYGGQSPTISVVPIADGPVALPPSKPLERQIILREGPDKGISLLGPSVPALQITGPGPELTNQVRFLADESLQYALEPKVIAPEITLKQELVPNKTTLEQLKINGLTSQTLWPKVNLELNQTKWGHAVDSISMHLLGSYTPLARDFGGEVLVTIDGTVVDRWPVDPTGIIDRSFAIPHDLINRSTNVLVTIHTTGDPGHCGDYLPMALRIDEKSQVEVTPTTPPKAPYPPGFQSVPQTMMPRVKFGIGTDTFGDTVRAAQIAAGMQQISSGVPLATTVTSLKEAIDSPEPAILVASNGWDDKNIGLPFSVDKETVTVQGKDADGKGVTLTVEPAMLYGSLQTVFDGNRTLLIATSNGAPQQIDSVLQWLNGQRGRWSGISGRALVSVAGSSDPVTVPNPSEDLTTPASEGGGTHSAADMVWKAAGGLAALAVVGALFIVVRTRRRQSIAAKHAVEDSHTTVELEEPEEDESRDDAEEREVRKERKLRKWLRLRGRKGADESPDEADEWEETDEADEADEGARPPGRGPAEPTQPAKPAEGSPTRFHATKKLNINRVVREVDQINEEIISHFTESDVPVRMTLEIDSDHLEMLTEEQRATLRDSLRALGFRDGDWSMD